MSLLKIVPCYLQMTVVASTAESKPDACTHWIDQPAIYHSVISIAHMNFAHAGESLYLQQLLCLLLVCRLQHLTACH